MNIRQYRKHLGYTQTDLGKRVGVSKSTLSMYENGLHEPDIETLKRLADVFGISLDDLVGRKPVDAYGSEIMAIPIQRNTTPMLQKDSSDECTDLPNGLKADFAIRCTDDSMAPLFQEGDLVLIRRQSEVEDGAVAVIVTEDGTQLKHVYRNGSGLTLTSNNPEYPPVTVKEKAAIQGLAVGYVRMFK